MSEGGMVKIYCPGCKKMVEINGKEVRLIVNTGLKENGSYEFICPITNVPEKGTYREEESRRVLEKNGAEVIYFNTFRCSCCGRGITLTWKRIQIVIDHNEEKAYRKYICPHTGARQMAPINMEELNELIQFCPAVQHLHIKKDPPIGYNDIIDFHHLLESEDWFKELHKNS